MSWPITWWAYTRDESSSDGIRRGAFSEHGVSSPIMRNIETGEETEDLPIGACWAAPNPAAYLPYTGGDGQVVFCMVPRTDIDRGKCSWMIDGRASNCTMPDDDGHRCWVRHGTIGQPLHIDKNGRTCAAGGGSIAVPGWHGFLHNGVLREDADPENRGPA